MDRVAPVRRSRTSARVRSSATTVASCMRIRC